MWWPSSDPAHTLPIEYCTCECYLSHIIPRSFFSFPVMSKNIKDKISASWPLSSDPTHTQCIVQICHNYPSRIVAFKIPADSRKFPEVPELEIHTDLLGIRRFYFRFFKSKGWNSKTTYGC